jgi:hypothetical protein
LLESSALRPQQRRKGEGSVHLVPWIEVLQEHVIETVDNFLLNHATSGALYSQELKVGKLSSSISMATSIHPVCLFLPLNLARKAGAFVGSRGQPCTSLVLSLG